MFWEEITPWIEKISNKFIEPSPVNFLFNGITGATKSYKNSVIPHLLNAAKRLIARHWKEAICPTLGEWKNEVD